MNRGMSGFQLQVNANNDITAVIGELGRTEDVKLSPDQNRLAVAEFSASRIIIFDIHIAQANGSPEITIGDYAIISSPSLANPHGIAFLDNQTVIVANRTGEVSILQLPESGANCKTHKLSPLASIKDGPFRKLRSPGSVCVVEEGPNTSQALICNNYIHRVTRHRIDRTQGIRIGGYRTLLEKDLHIPDGICISADRKWLAVSNHSTHEVLVYDFGRKLGRKSVPDARLQGVSYPHGLRFTKDGKYLIVADAGTQFVHAFSKPQGAWAGSQQADRSFMVLDEETFLRGRYNEEEGGAKGIEVDDAVSVLITTCEHQPLAFFDLQRMLAAA